MRVTFLVSKHPFADSDDGDTRVTRLLLKATAASCEVSVVALTSAPAASTRADRDVIEIPKPPPRIPRLLVSSALRRRSVIHVRFAPSSLTRTLSGIATDAFVARRVYMSQAAIDAGRTAPVDRLVVLVDVLESMAMRLRSSPLRPLLGLEATRTRRDEIRCIERASAAAYMSDTEIEELGGAISGPKPRLDLVLPPASRPAPLEAPTAVFVGDRRWAPNADALANLANLWPRVARAVPESQLVVVGHPARRERHPSDPSVTFLGFVDDLDDVWRSASLLVAPVRIGGGVRVKILDAARFGVPVVGTPAAIGSTSSYLPIEPHASADEFVADAIDLLSKPRTRLLRGAALFEANRELNNQGFVEQQLADLLTERHR
jgi:glycosyltransferase involved in cell wall biosynthesis